MPADPVHPSWFGATPAIRPMSFGGSGLNTDNLPSYWHTTSLERDFDAPVPIAPTAAEEIFGADRLPDKVVAPSARDSAISCARRAAALLALPETQRVMTRADQAFGVSIRRRTAPRRIVVQCRGLDRSRPR